MMAELNRLLLSFGFSFFLVYKTDVAGDLPDIQFSTNNTVL